MQGIKNVLSYFIGGTLAANQTITLVLPFAWTLEMISAYTSNNSDATIIVGNVADPNGWLTETTIGDSNSPVEFDHADWNGALYTALPNVVSGITRIHVAADEALVITIDFDGALGTAGANLMVNVLYSEG